MSQCNWGGEASLGSVSLENGETQASEWQQAEPHLG